MVEVGGEGQAVAQNIRSGKVDVYGIGTACVLCIVALDATYQRLIFL